MIELINKGGLINWLIVLLYFAVVGIGLERLLYFYFTRLKYSKFSFQFFDLICKKDDPKVQELLKKNSASPVARLAGTYLKYRQESLALRTEILEKQGAEEAEKMNNYLEVLSVIGHIAPLLGLLGTITGLIRVFRAIEGAGGAADISILSGGIWEAMLTTAAGLALAIPAFMLFRYFNFLANKRLSQMSHIISSLNVLYKKS